MLYQDTLLVSVYDINSKPLTNAAVKITVGKQSTPLTFDKYAQAYILKKLKPGRYTIAVSAKGLETQKRSVFIPASGVQETFVLGKKGLPSVYLYHTKVPFEPNHEQFGVVIKHSKKEPAVKTAAKLEKNYGLVLQKPHENYIRNGLFIFNYPSKLTEGAKQKLRNTLALQKNVKLTGTILKQDEKNASLLTDEMIVRFKNHLDVKEVAKIAARYKLTVLRTIPYAGNGWLFKINKGNGYNTLGIYEELAQSGLVEYAEPNLYITKEPAAITPGNFLFPEQWDHPIINTPDAWQVLNDRLGPEQKFGSPDVVIAIVDSGIDETHPHFNRNVSNGQPKIFARYDFIRIRPEIPDLQDSHGTCCASAAAGYTPVSSVPGGVADGTVGIAGNCRLMSIRPDNGTVVSDADMYIWIAGFDPESTVPGFPAPLPGGKGADIISNSFSVASMIAEVPGIMRDTFDYLTTYGRNGKGTIFLVCTGNLIGNRDFSYYTPWALSKKIFTCGASSLDTDGRSEIISTYSGQGLTVDFCAPSHREYSLGSIVFIYHRPPHNYAAITGHVSIDRFIESYGYNEYMPANSERIIRMRGNNMAGTDMLNISETLDNSYTLIVGNPSTNVSRSEAKVVTTTLDRAVKVSPKLYNNQNDNTPIHIGRPDYIQNFGGTSYATPVIAGIAALMLSVNNRLSWMEVRELIKATADKINPTYAHDMGRWKDRAGRISTQAGYSGPYFSQHFGYGRVNAAAAVAAAASYTFASDLLIRDNMPDNGLGTSATPHYEGVDIWVRNANDGVGPASYNISANNPRYHQPPKTGQANFVYVRYKNIGTQNSHPFYIRVYLAHYPGMEFTWPNNFIPTTRPGDSITSPMVPGTYLISEQLTSPLAAGASRTSVFEWPAALIPPQTVNVGGINVAWHPCLLVEITPHDGFYPTGNHVWDNNNLAQKNITISYRPGSAPGMGDDAGMVIIGNPTGPMTKPENIRIDILRESAGSDPYFVCFANEKTNKSFIAYARKNLTGITVARHKRTTVVWFDPRKKTRFELPLKGLAAMVIGTNRNSNDMVLQILQYRENKITGSYGMSFLKTKKDGSKK